MTNQNEGKLGENTTEGALSLTGSSVKLISDIVAISAKNDDTREAGKSLARSARILATALENVLLPIAAINAGAKKARDYFDNRFESELQSKIDEIPEDDIIEPAVRIAGPIMSGLAVVHEEDALKEAFLNLLRNSMDCRVSNAVHPGFSQIILNLTSEEAALFQLIFSDRDRLPMAELRIQADSNSGTYSLAARHVAPITPVYQQLPSYIDNWVRLGLVDIDYMLFFPASDAYAWVQERPEYLELQATMEVPSNLIFQKGILSLTDFGKRFFKSVIA